MSIVWRARARADMFDLVAYIANDKQGAAFRVHDQITNMISYLSDWPNLGRQSRRRGIRELAIPRTPYVVLYEVSNDEIVILRVLHGRQRR